MAQLERYNTSHTYIQVHSGGLSSHIDIVWYDILSYIHILESAMQLFLQWMQYGQVSPKQLSTDLTLPSTLNKQHLQFQLFASLLDFTSELPTLTSTNAIWSA